MANEKRLVAYDPVAFGEFTQSLRNTLEVYDPYSDGYEDGMGRIEDWLEYNYVDAVPVVRCKDCKHWSNATQKEKYCSYYRGMYDYCKADDFCSYGERREGE